mgnify:CR=1 FL=1
MFTFLVLFFTRFYKGVLKLHEEIGGRWGPYLANWWALKRYSRAHPKGRLDLHNVWKLEQEDGGMLPFEEETVYARPKLVSKVLFGYHLINKTHQFSFLPYSTLGQIRRPAHLRLKHRGEDDH